MKNFAILHGTRGNRGKHTTSRVHDDLLLLVSLLLFPLQGKRFRQQPRLGRITENYLGCTQPALTFVPSTEFGVAEGLSSFEAALLFGDFAWCLGDGRRWKGQVDAGVGALRSSPCADLSNSKLIRRGRTYSGVALLGLASLAGEDDKLGLVSLQPLDIESLALLAQVPPPVINNDTNTTSLLPANASLLQFGKSKPTSLPEFSVVADCRGTNSGSE
jgi:hypothetical protein